MGDVVIKPDNFEDYILNSSLNNSLFIVSCTEEKIWDYQKDAPLYLEAKNVYKGRAFVGFLNFIQKFILINKKINWIILSGKYGFIEPEHPITYYNVDIGNPEHYPISLDSLQNQTKQIRWWRVDGKNFVQVRLNDFKKIISVNCDDNYIGILKKCFQHQDFLIIDNVEQLLNGLDI